ESDGDALTVADEEALVDLPPFGTVTAVVWPVVPPAAGLQGEPPVPQGTTNLWAEPAGRDGTRAGWLEPAQPVYSRYWLHGKGPAPAGNLPVAVHVSPELTGLALDESSASAAQPAAGAPPPEPPPSAPNPPVAALRITVACGIEPASGTLRLLIPDELVAEADPQGPGADSGPLTGSAAYDLPAQGYAAWEVRVRARPGTPACRYVSAA